MGKLKVSELVGKAQNVTGVRVEKLTFPLGDGSNMTGSISRSRHNDIRAGTEGQGCNRETVCVGYFEEQLKGYDVLVQRDEAH
jgi:hypothetical protein